VDGIDVSAAEIVVATSALLAGLLIVRGRPLPIAAWAVLFAVAGLFHGYAYGESIFGAETSPLGAYLLGLVVIQSALTVGTALLARRMGGGVSQLAPRIAGAAVGGVGFAVLVGQLIPGA
jgi:urease accessory protein